MKESADDDPRFDAAALGYRMPAEFEPHAATWMAWPCRPELWGESMAGVKRDMAGLARAIAQFEPLFLVARPEDAADAAAACGPAVRVVEIPIDDSWIRDSGPTFITNGRDLVGTVWRFNAWGNKYHPHDADAELARRLVDRLGTPVVCGDLVLEGGSILSDGEGTLFTTESCLLNANRNPGLTRAAVEVELKRVLGAHKVVWMPGDPSETETDGHIDGLLALVAPGAALIEAVDDPADPRAAILRENRRALELATDAKGRSLHLRSIEEARPGPGPRYCRSYVNFYLVNGGVIAPAYGQPADRRVESLLRSAYGGRRVVMLPIGEIALGGGGFHCVTQQQPATAPGIPPS